MNEDEIIARLRAEANLTTAAGLARRLDELTNGRLTQGAIVTYFKRAFPSIPLRILREAGGWIGVGGSSMTDDEFNALLRPWLRGRESPSS